MYASQDLDETLTAQCPWCDEMRPLVPHDTKPGRLVAFCYCQGDRREFLETNAPHYKRRKKESE